MEIKDEFLSNERLHNRLANFLFIGTLIFAACVLGYCQTHYNNPSDLNKDEVAKFREDFSSKFVNGFDKWPPPFVASSNLDPEEESYLGSC